MKTIGNQLWISRFSHLAPVICCLDLLKVFSIRYLGLLALCRLGLGAVFSADVENLEPTDCREDVDWYMHSRTLPEPCPKSNPKPLTPEPQSPKPQQTEKRLQRQTLRFAPIREAVEIPER